MPARRQVLLDDAGRIAEDIPCRGCGYNLRGLGPQGICPECSTAIGRSVHGDLLQFCDPSWVGRMAKGLQLIIIGLLVNVAYAFIFGFAIMFLSTTGTITMTTAIAVAAAIGAALSLITVIGAWMLTTADPGHTETEPPITARRLARWCILARVAAAPLQMAGSTTGGMVFGNPAAAISPLLAIIMIVGMAIGIIILVGDAAALIYLRQLALRIPRESLAKQTRIVMWGYVSSQAVNVALATVMMLLVRASMAPGGAPGPAVILPLTVAFGAGCLAGIAALVFGIWALVLLFIYGGALRQAATAARSTWAAVA